MGNLGKILKKYRWILAIIVFMILLYVCVDKRSEYKWINIPVITKHNRIKECKKILLWTMKSPTTAKFSDIEYTVTKQKNNTWEYYVDEESWAKMSVKLLSWLLSWTYIDLSWDKSSWNINILTWWYIKTLVENNKKMVESENIRQEIHDSIYSLDTRYELDQAKKEYTDKFNEWVYLLRSSAAVRVVIKRMDDVVVIGNTDSQNWYGAMVRSKFYCEKVNNEEMFWELLE